MKARRLWGGDGEHAAYRRLAFAILLRAVEDWRHGDEAALRWLRAGAGAVLLALVDVPADRIDWQAARTRRTLRLWDNPAARKVYRARRGAGPG